MKQVKLLLLLLFTVFLAGCSTVSDQVPNSQTDETGSEEVQAVEKAAAAEDTLTDVDSLYEDWDSCRVLTMYLTVSTGNEADSSNHTWSEVNAHSTYYYDDLGIDRYKVEGILQIDDGDGLNEESFGYGETVPNVSVQVRGQTSSYMEQKNYKIRIKDGKGSFCGQRTLNLNKHAVTPFRFENNLAYTLMSEVPQLVAGRTVFVHLIVKDTTEGGNGEFVDYGLYTMVEQVNHTYLRSHGLNDTGELYKVTFFEWYPYDAIMATGDDYDEDAFEEYLEIKGSDDPSSLQNAVEALQNYKIPIEDIIEQYFDAENICYWVAFNILVGNYDSGSRNLFLYSPANSEKIYILPWDMDDSFRLSYNDYTNYTDGDSWERGTTQFTGLILCKRMFKEEKYVNMLSDAVEDLYHGCLSRENVASLVAEMSEVTEKYVFNEPDSEYRNLDTLEEYEELADKIPDDIEENYNYYYESLKNPWPFYIGTPQISDGNLILSWDASYDPLGKGVTYSYWVSDDTDFSHVLAEDSGLVIPTASIDALSPGTYYLKVKAFNKDGYSTDCFDYISESGKGKIYGCYEFTVNEDGSVTVGGQ